MPVFLAPILAWLKSKFGAFAGAILFVFVEKLFGWVKKKVSDFFYWLAREQKQKEATEKVEQDVQDGKPRDEETRKREDDWLNS
jgi:hypothetical protein